MAFPPYRTMRFHGEPSIKCGTHFCFDMRYFASAVIVKYEYQRHGSRRIGTEIWASVFLVTCNVELGQFHEVASLDPEPLTNYSTASYSKNLYRGHQYNAQCPCLSKSKLRTKRFRQAGAGFQCWSGEFHDVVSSSDLTPVKMSEVSGRECRCQKCAPFLNECCGADGYH
jgi:hypothetical protein